MIDRKSNGRTTEVGRDSEETGSSQRNIAPLGEIEQQEVSTVQ